MVGTATSSSADDDVQQPGDSIMPMKQVKHSTVLMMTILRPMMMMIPLLFRQLPPPFTKVKNDCCIMDRLRFLEPVESSVKKRSAPCSHPLLRSLLTKPPRRFVTRGLQRYDSATLSLHYRIALLAARVYQ